MIPCFRRRYHLTIIFSIATIDLDRERRKELRANHPLHSLLFLAACFQRDSIKSAANIELAFIWSLHRPKPLLPLLLQQRRFSERGSHWWVHWKACDRSVPIHWWSCWPWLQLKARTCQENSFGLVCNKRNLEGIMSELGFSSFIVNLNRAFAYYIDRNMSSSVNQNSSFRSKSLFAIPKI